MTRRRSVRFRVQNLMNESAEPIFMLNADREIVFFNRACEELTGRPAESVLGLYCRFRGPAGDSDLTDLGASLAPPPEVLQGKTASVESLILRPDGQRLWRQVHFFPCHDKEQRLMSVIGLVSECSSAPGVSSTTDPQLHAALLKVRDRLWQRYGIDKIVGTSSAMHRVLTQVRLASQIDAHVMIWGERGTGRNLIARTIHQESSRRVAPFLPIDCALVPAAMLERDFFGPAVSDELRESRPGLLHTVRGGTLFLKNLSHMSRDVQARLAERLKEDSAAPRVAAGQQGSLRVIASDTQDPAAAFGSGQLRADLFYALSTIVIHLPPLRARREDLPLLAQMFVEHANGRGNKQLSGLAPAALEILLTYDWPENVRELGQVIEESHQQCSSNRIAADDITARIQGARGGAFTAQAALEQKVDLDAVLVSVERRLIEQALQRAQGNKSQAADLLSISRPRLYRRLHELGIDGDDSTEAVCTQPDP